MEKILFVRKDCVLGGNETLILRMAKWLILNNYNVSLLCNYESKEFKLENEKVGLKIIKIDDWINLSIDNLGNNYRDTKLKVICFNIYDYLFLKLNSKNSYNILLYVVHPYTLFLGEEKGKKKYMKIFRYPIYKILHKGYENNEIVFMDKDCIEKTEKYYNQVCTKKTIVKLPIDIPSNSYKSQNKKEIFTILTIARADFPFKGYILGLIDDFIKLESKINNIKLCIISSGKDECVIEKKLSDRKSPNIVFIKGCASEELEKYYNNANLYIGMGTTVLLAASYGIPVLLVEPYTYSCKVGGLFNENYDLVEANPSIISDCYEEINKIYNMPDDEYMLLKKDTYKKVVQNYSADFIIPSLINNINESENLSFLQKVIVKILAIMKRVLLRRS